MKGTDGGRTDRHTSIQRLMRSPRARRAAQRASGNYVYREESVALSPAGTSETTTAHATSRL